MKLLARFAWALAALLLSIDGAAAAPAITLTSAGGPPKTPLTVSGSGFGANQLIDVYFDTIDKCLTASNAAGAFSCPVKVPRDAQPQYHWFTAAQRSSGLAAQASFFVYTDWPQFHGLDARHTGVN